jgi:hypothetical protein
VTRRSHCERFHRISQAFYRYPPRLLTRIRGTESSAVQGAMGDWGDFVAHLSAGSLELPGCPVVGAENKPAEPDPGHAGEGSWMDRRRTERSAPRAEPGLARREPRLRLHAAGVKEGAHGGTMGFPVLKPAEPDPGHAGEGREWL